MDHSNVKGFGARENMEVWFFFLGLAAPRIFAGFPALSLYFYGRCICFLLQYASEAFRSSSLFVTEGAQTSSRTYSSRHDCCWRCLGDERRGAGKSGCFVGRW